MTTSAMLVFVAARGGAIVEEALHQVDVRRDVLAHYLAGLLHRHFAADDYQLAILKLREDPVSGSRIERVGDLAWQIDAPIWPHPQPERARASAFDERCLVGAVKARAFLPHAAQVCAAELVAAALGVPFEDVAHMLVALAEEARDLRPRRARCRQGADAVRRGRVGLDDL